MGTRSKVQLSLLMLELLHLCQRFSSFFKIFFGSLYSSLFDLFGGFASSGKSLLRRPFSETPVHSHCFSTGKLSFLFSFCFYSLHRGCVLSGWGAKGFAFTLFSSFR